MEKPSDLKCKELVMRKYILYIGFLLLSFASCQEKEIIGYSLERDGLQFNYDTNALRVTVDFMKEYVTDTMRWGPGDNDYYLEPKYSGDSLLKKGVNAYFCIGKALLRGQKSQIEMARSFEASRLLSETDAPYMTLKGESFSSLTDIIQVVDEIAHLRNIEKENLKAIFLNNFRESFGID